MPTYVGRALRVRPVLQPLVLVRVAQVVAGGEDVCLRVLQGQANSEGVGRKQRQALVRVAQVVAEMRMSASGYCRGQGSTKV